MGLFDFLSAFSSGTSLKVATKSAPNSMGCYKIFLNGSLKYVGKAEDGIRKRFVQYYNGTTAHYPSAQKIYEHRDEISVAWVVLQSRQECRDTEAEWIDRYNQHFDNEHNNDLEYINFDGQEAYYKGSDEYSVFIWDNGDYIFAISGNLTKTEIVELAKTLKMKND